MAFATQAGSDSRSQWHSRQVRLREYRRVAQLAQHVGPRLSGGEPLLDVTAQLQRDLLSRGRGAREVREQLVEIGVRGGHGCLPCPINRVIASAKANHSVVSAASSSRPASVSW